MVQTPEAQTPAAETQGQVAAHVMTIAERNYAELPKREAPALQATILAVTPVSDKVEVVNNLPGNHPKWDTNVLKIPADQAEATEGTAVAGTEDAVGAGPEAQNGEPARAQAQPKQAAAKPGKAQHEA